MIIKFKLYPVGGDKKVFFDKFYFSNPETLEEQKFVSRQLKNINESTGNLEFFFDLISSRSIYL